MWARVTVLYANHRGNNSTIFCLYGSTEPHPAIFHNKPFHERDFSPNRNIIRLILEEVKKKKNGEPYVALVLLYAPSHMHY